MDITLAQLLENADNDGIRDYFFQLEMEYYNNDMADIIIDLGVGIKNYDCLVDSLGIENAALSTEFFTDDKAMYTINTYKTDTANLYFVRTEEFALDDGYDVTNQLKFTVLEKE